MEDNQNGHILGATFDSHIRKPFIVTAMNQLGSQEHNIFVLWPGYHIDIGQRKTEQVF